MLQQDLYDQSLEALKAAPKGTPVEDVLRPIWGPHVSDWLLRALYLEALHVYDTEVSALLLRALKQRRQPVPAMPKLAQQGLAR